jgi:hypothetical protein
MKLLALFGSEAERTRATKEKEMADDLAFDQTIFDLTPPSDD